MTRLLSAIIVGIALAAGTVVLASNALRAAADGTPSQATLYQYGNR